MLREYKVQIPNSNNITINDLSLLLKFDENYSILNYSSDFITFGINLDQSNFEEDLGFLSRYFTKNLTIGKYFYVQPTNFLKNNKISLLKRDLIFEIDSKNFLGNLLLNDLLSDGIYRIEKISNSKYRVYGLDELNIPRSSFEKIITKDMGKFVENNFK